MNPANLLSHLPGVSATGPAPRRPAAEPAPAPCAFAATLGESLLALAGAAGETGHLRPGRAAADVEEEPAPNPAQDALALLLAGALAPQPLREAHAPRTLAAPASGGAQGQAMPLPSTGDPRLAPARPEVASSLPASDALSAAFEGAVGDAAAEAGATLGAASAVPSEGKLGEAMPAPSIALDPNSPAEHSRDAAVRGVELTAATRGPAAAGAEAQAWGPRASPDADAVELQPAAQAGAPDPASAPAPWAPAPAVPAGTSPQAAGPAQAQVTVPVGSPEWAPAVARQVAGLGPGREIELHLHPAELGPLHVKLSLVDNRAHVVFASEHAAVRQALEAGLPQLRTGLADSGIALGQATVGSGSGQPTAQHGGQESPSRHPQSQEQAQAATSETSRAAASQPPLPSAGGPRRALDTFA